MEVINYFLQGREARMVAKENNSKKVGADQAIHICLMDKPIVEAASVQLQLSDRIRNLLVNFSP